MNAVVIKKQNSPLLWAGLAFGLMFAAWITFFVIAARHKVEEVPLQTQPKDAR
jgi:hypothetical protein